MKNSTRVAEILVELHNLTENDLERAIVERCANDLFISPKPVIIDNDHQMFLGIVYKKNSNGHFAKDLRIHQAVWSFFNGEIPKGYQIHHIDENKANNNISNLQCLTASDHQLLHWQKPRHIGAEREFTCDNCGRKYKAIDNGRNRYCPECKPKIQYASPVKRRRYEKICPICGKVFITKYKNGIYCSHNCAAKSNAEKHHREPLIYNKTCTWCGKEFTTDQPKKKFCSKECREAYYKTDHVCANCGKTFRSKDKNAIYCSRECSGEARKKHEQRRCVVCGKFFSPSHASDKTQCCSRECGKKLIGLSNQKREMRMCPVCGKSYETTPKDKRKTCSKSCAAKLLWQKRCGKA